MFEDHFDEVKSGFEVGMRVSVYPPNLDGVEKLSLRMDIYARIKSAFKDLGVTDCLIELQELCDLTEDEAIYYFNRFKSLSGHIQALTASGVDDIEAAHEFGVLLEELETKAFNKYMVSNTQSFVQ